MENGTYWDDPSAEHQRQQTGHADVAERHRKSETSVGESTDIFASYVDVHRDPKTTEQDWNYRKTDHELQKTVIDYTPESLTKEIKPKQSNYNLYHRRHENISGSYYGESLYYDPDDVIEIDATYIHEETVPPEGEGTGTKTSRAKGSFETENVGPAYTITYYPPGTSYPGGPYLVIEPTTGGTEYSTLYPTDTIDTLEEVSREPGVGGVKVASKGDKNFRTINPVLENTEYVLRGISWWPVADVVDGVFDVLHDLEEQLVYTPPSEGLGTFTTPKPKMGPAQPPAQVPWAMMQTIGEIALSVVFEPADWFFTAREIYNDPTNPWSYVGLIPGIPAGVGVIAKQTLRRADDLTEVVEEVVEELVDSADNLDGSIVPPKGFAEPEVEPEKLEDFAAEADRILQESAKKRDLIRNMTHASAAASRKLNPGEARIAFIDRHGNQIGHLYEPGIGHDNAASFVEGLRARIAAGDAFAVSVGKEADGTIFANGSATFGPLPAYLREIAKGLVE